MIKKINNELSYYVHDWWIARTGGPFLDDADAPEHAWMAFVNDKPIVAGFMYISDDKKMGFIAYIVFNPDVTSKEKDTGFKELVNEFHKQAKELNIKNLFTTTNQSSLSNRFRTFGFTECDIDVVHLIKPIKGE